MAQITLEVSDEQLEQFKKTVERYGDGTCTNPILMLTKMLQSEVENIDCYTEYVFDAGGNSIGDVFDEWDEFFIETNMDEED